MFLLSFNTTQIDEHFDSDYRVVNKSGRIVTLSSGIDNAYHKDTKNSKAL
jgi:hypothetical protein